MGLFGFDLVRAKGGIDSAVLRTRNFDLLDFDAPGRAGSERENLEGSRGHH
jgi:hypothetical protein